MRHLCILVSIGLLFSQCTSDQSSDSSVYDKQPTVISENLNSNDEINSAAEASTDLSTQVEETIEDEKKIAEAAKAALLEKKAAEEKKAQAAAKKKAQEKAQAAAKKKAQEKAKAEEQAKINAAKKDTRIRPTPRDEKLSTNIVSNPKTASTTGRPQTAKPIFQWQTKVHDFGWVDEGKKVQFSYNFKNVGNEALIILEANADCGCTVPSYSKKPIPPGGTGSLDVIFDTKSKAGRQDKKITILANTIPNYTELRIQGMVDNRPKNDDKNGTSAGSGSKPTSRPTSQAAKGSLLDKLKNKVEKDGE